jgi:hypothetical protein
MRDGLSRRILVTSESKANLAIVSIMLAGRKHTECKENEAQGNKQGE